MPPPPSSFSSLRASAVIPLPRDHTTSSTGPQSDHHRSLLSAILPLFLKFQSHTYLQSSRVVFQVVCGINIGDFGQEYGGNSNRALSLTLFSPCKVCETTHWLWFVSFLLSSHSKERTVTFWDDADRADKGSRKAAGRLGLDVAVPCKAWDTAALDLVWIRQLSLNLHAGSELGGHNRILCAAGQD